MASFSGEIYEYIELAKSRHRKGEKYSEYALPPFGTKRGWYDTVKEYLDDWVEEHRSSDKPDDWTPSEK